MVQRQPAVEALLHHLQTEIAQLPHLAVPEQQTRPHITLSFAQTIDGSIAARPGAPTRLSGDLSSAFTHSLRATHDAILVGIGTVLADNPRLTTRSWDGPDPRAVILDSSLRTPLDAALFDRSSPGPIILYDQKFDQKTELPFRAEQLNQRGATCLATSVGDLSVVFSTLHEHGIASILVEGGATVITSVLEAHLADYLAITVSPRMLGGFRYAGASAALERPGYHRLGDDLIITGAVLWQ
ncbi:MAG: RibD family protein [Spirochaeta sp.]|nr:RibD family protein [Spirochaeta sp.]